VTRVYRDVHFFCGLGGFARGFQRGLGRFGAETARFAPLGGVDCDGEACEDFGRLTGLRALQADVAAMTPEDLRRFCGDEAPDVVAASPPCKSHSGLISNDLAATPKYQAMAELAVRWLWLTLEAWPSRPPRIIVMENVPRITSRGAPFLHIVRSLLQSYGYAVHEAAHDCGALGGLAQHRQRYLILARHRESVPVVVYRPVPRRVRPVGEVIGPLAFPDDPAAGAHHRLPRIEWLTWLRLALIPAGKDWRSLPEGPYAMVAAPEALAQWKGRPGPMGVADWSRPTRAIIGKAGVTQSNGIAAVADPTFPEGRVPFNHVLRTVGWAEPSPAVTSSDGYVADPRLERPRHKGAYGVMPWDRPGRTVIGGPANGTEFVADPRASSAEWFGDVYGVVPWTEPSGAVTGRANSSTGAFTVADPRLGCEPRNGTYGVIPWDTPAGTVTGAADVHAARAAIQDPRDVRPLRDRPDPPPVVISPHDGTWHRPLTTLELAALQSIDLRDPQGRPVELAGRSQSRHRERIGNAVPPDAAQAIADVILTSLLASDLGFAFALGGGEYWVRREEEPLDGLMEGCA